LVDQDVGDEYPGGAPAIAVVINFIYFIESTR
jgi:hypothetical protein